MIPFETAFNHPTYLFHMNIVPTAEELQKPLYIDREESEEPTLLRLKLLSQHQKELLELSAGDAPISDGLNALVRAARSLRGADTRAAVFIFDPEAAKLKFAASTGLSTAYTQVIDGFPVGPTQPSCGKAAYVGEDVIVRDVAQDALWAPYLHLAEEHGIRACWSFLLRSSEGHTLGTFALYHPSPCEPSEEDYAEIQYLARIASLLVTRHIMSESRTQQESTLRQSDDNKDHFLALLAHELRNPLGALKNAVKIAQLAGEQPVPRERALEVMSRQITQMEWLIEDLLDANRIARGEMRLVRQRIELKPVLELALETVMPQFNRKQQVVTVRMPANSIFLEADATRVNQMVTNLLNNACKFTPIEGTVTLDVALLEGAVEISVSDNGIGLEMKDRDSIFKRFAQKDSGASNGLGGLGLGLTLVKELASLHGGSVEVSSEGLGKGSKFILSMPVILD